MTETTYDLAVIGSGPAGEKGAAQAAYFGKRVALIEKHASLGGAAANTGTLPSKTLRETALMLSGLRARDLYGVDLSLQREATVRDFLHRERQVVGRERQRVQANLQRHDIDHHQGHARFIDAHTLEIEDDSGERSRVVADTFLIATGARPRRPDTFAFADSRIWDSNQILDISFLPQTLAVIGGGVIGSEYACTFAALGTDVVLLDGRAEYMGFLDEDISTLLKQQMERIGVTFADPDRVTRCDANETDVVLSLGKGTRISVDAVLVAAGRISNTDALDLDKAGVEVGDRGKLNVNAFYQTNVPHIYAAGDVIGFPALASTSMEQARMAMVHAFNLGYKTQVAPVLPFGIYTIPEVSTVGQTEKNLAEKDIDYVVGKALYRDNPRGTIIGDEAGVLKLIFDRAEMRLLGAQVLGEQASELVHVGVMALMAGADADFFIRACFNYPTLGDLYKYATYDALGKR